MNVQNIFYGVGVLFILLAVLYFAFTFLRAMDDNVKLIVLIISVLVSFVVAELLRGSGH